MGRRSRSPGAITRFTNPADPKNGWRRFRFTDPGVVEGGITAGTVYSSLTEDADKTRWVTDDYGDNNLTTSGRGACNGRVWCKPLLNSMGQPVLLTDSFVLRVVIEHIAVTGDDWGGSGEPEPWMSVGLTGQPVAADVPSNNHLGLSVNFYSRQADGDQYKNTRVGYESGTISDTSTGHYAVANANVADSFPAFYYGDIHIGPDTDDTAQLNTTINVRSYDNLKNHFGPSQWKMHEPGDTAAIEDTGPAYVFVALSPEGGDSVGLTAGNPITTDFRIWYMVQNDTNWVPVGNP